MGENSLSGEEIRRLYERHGPALVVYACGYGLDAASAEDAVHTVFQRLLGDRIPAPRNAAGYIYRAVRNAALNVRRGAARETPMENYESVFAHQGGNREATLTLQKALSELPEEQREAIVMRIWSGMTLEEIATSQDVSLNTIASRYRYGLEKLREKMRPFEPARKDKVES
ncbi:MAG TPA: sigma-70 family RNA polymerase sigma factor [Candidatus Acidoferrum sp.]|nr:sigma-70 family RNA polymerase sigma factor [Candidatus Acidoferrum sp.]